MSRRDFQLASIFFSFTACLFFFPLLLGKTFFVGDILYSFRPWLTYSAQHLQSGLLPLWNPYSACGEPFMANPQNMLFFPPALLFSLFPFRLALTAFYFLTTGIIFLVSYLLARRWMVTSRLGSLLTALACRSL